MSMIEAASIIFKKNKPNGLTIKKEKKVEPSLNHLISDITRAKLISLMEDNVLHGTGKRAAVNGYRVGGKTATGEKTNNQGLYDKDKLVSSFLSILSSSAL